MNAGRALHSDTIKRTNIGGDRIIVSKRQDGNPVLRFIRNVKWEFGDVLPDYLINEDTFVLYLSLRYHVLHPDYLSRRFSELGHKYKLLVVICQADTEDPADLVNDLNSMSMIKGFTLLLAWSHEDAAHYIEALKQNIGKSTEDTRANLGVKPDENDLARVSECLTTIRVVNKSDVSSLLSTFQSLRSICTASTEDLAVCPGLGPTKVKKIYETMREPFMAGTQRKTPSRNYFLNGNGGNEGEEDKSEEGGLIE